MSLLFLSQSLPACVCLPLLPTQAAKWQRYQEYPVKSLPLYLVSQRKHNILKCKKNKNAYVCLVLFGPALPSPPPPQEPKLLFLSTSSTFLAMLCVVLDGALVCVVLSLSLSVSLHRSSSSRLRLSAALHPASLLLKGTRWPSVSYKEWHVLTFLQSVRLSGSQHLSVYFFRRLSEPFQKKTKVE